MTDVAYQVEQEIIKLTHEWLKAVGQRDFATLDRIIADDFLIAGWLPEGQLGDKKLYLEDCMRPVDWQQPTYSYERWQFRVYNNIVIANCIFKFQALVGGKEWGGVFLITYVWINRSGSWQVTICHTSPMVAATAEQAG